MRKDSRLELLKGGDSWELASPVPSMRKQTLYHTVSIVCKTEMIKGVEHPPQESGARPHAAPRHPNSRAGSPTALHPDQPPASVFPSPLSAPGTSPPWLFPFGPVCFPLDGPRRHGPRRSAYFRANSKFEVFGEFDRLANPLGMAKGGGEIEFCTLHTGKDAVEFIFEASEEKAPDNKQPQIHPRCSRSNVQRCKELNLIRFVQRTIPCTVPRISRMCSEDTSLLNPTFPADYIFKFQNNFTTKCLRSESCFSSLHCATVQNRKGFAWRMVS